MCLTIKFINRGAVYFLFLMVTLILAACKADPAQRTLPETSAGPGYELPSVYRGMIAVSFEEVIAAASAASAVLVGETHDRLDHHLNQLEIIRELHRQRPRLAIGMEQFQQPFQAHLNDYINGVINTEEMLIATEYYERWKYDFRLYEPIVSYAREHQIPVIALNVPVELTHAVAAKGLEALDKKELARLPLMDRSDVKYRARLKQVYEEHRETMSSISFENFYTAQLLWDEGMAARAAEYLRDNPGAIVVVLAGQGHIEFGSGIPNRLARRIDGQVISIVHGKGEDVEGERANYVLDSQPIELPKRGLLGVIINPTSEEALISDVMPNGAAGAAGLKIGDVVTAVDGRSVTGVAELKAQLWDNQPGDRVSVTVRRGPNETLLYDVILR